MNIEYYLSQTIKNYKLQKINKNIFLTNYEINILNINKINYKNCSSYNDILYLIDETLQTIDNQELEQISLSISERNYYQNTNK